MRKPISLTAILFFLILKAATGQQEPVFTQYMFARQIFNPAYNGNWESINVTLIARNQWQGFEKRPQTQAFLVEAPMRNGQVALGFSAVNDNIGLEKKLSFAADYSFRVKMGQKSNLSLGLKASVANYSNNLSEYQLFDPSDPKFSGEIQQKTVPNFGVGAFYYCPGFYIGFSVPRLIENTFKNSENYLVSGAEQSHFYLTGSYTCNVMQGFKFNPAFLAKGTAGAPPQFDISANFILAEQFSLGASFRTNDSFGFLCQWVIARKFRLGYATDFTITKFKNYNDGTHEILLSIDINSVREDYVSPRIF